MPGTGPAPKLPGERRRYNQPMRGEWVDLEPLEEPILREYDPMWDATLLLDENGEPRELWPRGVRREMWEAWRWDPVTSQYGPADIAAIEELAQHFYALSYADQDRRMNQLGLTPKGKRDLRWRTPNEVKTIKKQAEKAPVRHIRAVGEQK
jgi:hypothetical protein